MKFAEKTAGASTLGARLKEWRAHLGVTQAKFAEVTKINLPMVKKYESGVTLPGSDALAAIAFTGVHLDWLVTGSGSMLDAPRRLRRKSIDAFDVAKTNLGLPVDVDKNVAKVFMRLMELTQYKGHLPWLPRNLTIEQCHALAKQATALLGQGVAAGDQWRLNALFLMPSVIDAGLLLAWKRLELMNPEEISELATSKAVYAAEPTEIFSMEASMPTGMPLREDEIEASIKRKTQSTSKY